MAQTIRVTTEGKDVVIRLSEEAADARPFAKIDEEQRIVFGWANVCLDCSGAPVVDSHDDIIDPTDFEKAAYDFNLEFHKAAFGENHEGEAKGRLVESVFFTPDKLEAMGLKKNALPTSWWVGFKIDDEDAWDRIKKGEHKMFSIQGTAVRSAA